MVFINGRGRPPAGGPKVGTVSWDEKYFCFVGSNGFYWHGTKFGGWQSEPPDESPENRKRPVSMCRGRRPTGNERVGVDVTYNIEHDCYQTNKQYFWHGTYQGGWKRNPPGTDFLSDDEEEEDFQIESTNGNDEDGTRSSKRQKKGNTKGRPPRRQIIGELIEYDTNNSCWTTDRDGGLYWHGTYNGGWKVHPPKKVR
mmetsp:Transcript_103646/g.211518  ORF Transcript_103646/g.211518 Transcript_103646/m.211518 type:complete len:198 (+) Transcript_103646:149-742(+)